jgi:maleate isomerase
VVQRFTQAAGTPCISAWTALRDALGKLRARRLVIGTPYPASIHALVPRFFAERGFDVTSHGTLDIVAMREVPAVDATRLQAFVRTLRPRGCDALVLLATDLPTFNSIATLEQEHDIAVLTSNQTLLWAAFSNLKGPVPKLALGRLFQ